ncbi:MAG: hypothetical protein LBF41_05130 [Deltaproteobacteria bacterium]|jgi:hypothetical protein|nr:hypothetical protein [Deltaproteobacteria bacterium]
MPKFTKIFISVCALSFVLFGAVATDVQSQMEISKEAVEAEPPLTQADIDAFVEFYPKFDLKESDAQDENFEKVAKAMGITPTRLVYIIMKSSVGIMIVSDPSKKEEYLSDDESGPMVPNDAEQAIIAKNINEIIAAMSSQYR